MKIVKPLSGTGSVHEVILSGSIDGHRRGIPSVHQSSIISPDGLCSEHLEQISQVLVAGYKINDIQSMKILCLGTVLKLDLDHMMVHIVESYFIFKLPTLKLFLIG